MSASTKQVERERGIALLEITLTLVVLSILIVVVGSVLDTGLGAYRTTSPMVVRQMTHRAVDRIADGISFAGQETLVLDADGAGLSFRGCLGSKAGTKSWSSLNRIEWRPDPEDPSDGKDNDRDGAVDEGMVILRQDIGETGERMTVLARDVARHLQGEKDNAADDNGNGAVDELGLLFQVDPSAVRISLTLQRRGEDGQPLLRTARALVAMRN